MTFAETITTHKGTIYKGNIVSIDENLIIIESEDGNIKIKRALIKSIDITKTKNNDNNFNIAPIEQNKDNEIAINNDTNSMIKNDSPAFPKTCDGEYHIFKKGFRLKFALNDNELKPHKIDDIFELKLAQDYKTKNKLVLKKGTIFKAKVTKIPKGKIYNSGIIEFDYMPLILPDGSEIQLVRTRKESTGGYIGKRIAAYAIFGAPSLFMNSDHTELEADTRIYGYMVKETNVCSE